MNRGGERESERAEGKMAGSDGFDWEAHSANRGLLGQQNYVDVNRAAVRLQRWWRRVRQKRKRRAEVAKVIFMQAVRLQRWWRRVRQRERLRKAAIVVQQRWRATLEMRMQRAFFLRLKRSALAFETRLLYLEHLKEKRAALAVQRWWRMVKQRREKAQENARIKAEEDQMEQEEASVREKEGGKDEDGDETVTTRPEQVEASVGMGSPQSERRAQEETSVTVGSSDEGSSEKLRAHTGENELGASPPHHTTTPEK